jgi:hypothetical protein
MKILAITKVFEPSKMLLLFITEDKEKTKAVKRVVFCCGSIS